MKKEISALIGLNQANLTKLTGTLVSRQNISGDLVQVRRDVKLYRPYHSFSEQSFLEILRYTFNTTGL